MSHAYVLMGKSGFPPFDYMLSNWTETQIRAMARGLSDLEEMKMEAMENQMKPGHPGRSSGMKRVDDKTFLSQIGIKPGLPPRVPKG